MLPDRVDGGEGKSQETVAGALGKLRGELGGELDGLVLDGQAADGDVVGAAVTGRGGAVAVGDLPGLAGKLLERGRLGGVKYCVVLLRGRVELGGEDLL